MDARILENSEGSRSTQTSGNLNQSNCRGGRGFRRPNCRQRYSRIPSDNGGPSNDQVNRNRGRGGHQRRGRRGYNNAFQNNRSQSRGNGPVDHPVAVSPDTTISEDVESLEERVSSLDLRESLIGRLRSGCYACAICLASVKPRDAIWSCDECYQVCHLTCIKEWAASENQVTANETFNPEEMRLSWRCPHCQKRHTPQSNPLAYRCFCGKVNRPEYQPGVSTVPHGCDEVCGKLKRNIKNTEDQENSRIPPCPHTCTELCHPGPCPPCTALVQMLCPCGRVTETRRCGEEQPKPCGAPCDRPLEKGLCAFGTHRCSLDCHDGPCAPCKKLIKSVCYCGRVDEVTHCGSTKAQRYCLSELGEAVDADLLGDLEACDVEMFYVDDDVGGCESKAELVQKAAEGSLEALFVGTVFSCEGICNRPLGCGHHLCTEECHPDACKPCRLLPEYCRTCPCGRVALSKLVMNGDELGNRKECTDPIPVCPNVCGRPNPFCGHPCPVKCHPGPECPPCQLTTQINCRCGKSSKEIPCAEYAKAVQSDPSSIQFLCGKVCRKKKSCGRHKCNRKCCDMVVHLCEETCGRLLSCGKHNCEDLCHCGPCRACWRGVITEEIYCHCGATWLSPPQPCGTAPPPCDRPCTRQHPCDHPVNHTCHSDPACPKCTVLMSKPCPGGHTWMHNVPCFQPVVTCGRRCDKPLPECGHTCDRQCHAGACLAPGAVCTQPCTTPRPDCGHPCGQPCHAGPRRGENCAKVLTGKRCEVKVPLVCSCGLRKEDMPCYQVKSLVTALSRKDPNFLLSCSKALQGSGDLPFGLRSAAVLPCDAACSRRVAGGGGGGQEEPAPRMWVRGGAAVVEDPSVGLPPAFAPPEYSEWLRQFASNNLTFATDVESVLCDLVDKVLKQVRTPDGKYNPNKVEYHRFNPMNSSRRRFIVELAEYYGIECVELDPPPHRYVEALATAGRVRFPGGGRRYNCASLASQMEGSFVGAVKVGPSEQAPVHAAARPAPLRVAATAGETAPTASAPGAGESATTSGLGAKPLTFSSIAGTNQNLEDPWK